VTTRPDRRYPGREHRGCPQREDQAVGSGFIGFGIDDPEHRPEELTPHSRNVGETLLEQAAGPRGEPSARPSAHHCRVISRRSGDASACSPSAGSSAAGACTRGNHSPGGGGACDGAARRSPADASVCPLHHRCEPRLIAGLGADAATASSTSVIQISPYRDLSLPTWVSSEQVAMYGHVDAAMWWTPRARLGVAEAIAGPGQGIGAGRGHPIAGCADPPSAPRRPRQVGFLKSIVTVGGSR
jgi:hypothetical protein